MTGNSMTHHQTAQEPSQPAMARRIACRAVWLLAICSLIALAGPASAQTGYVGILGAGAVVQHIKKNIEELSDSGFNEVMIWSLEVGATGDLNLDGGFPLTSNGTYIGNQTYPDFPGDMVKIKKSGKVTRFTLTIGSSNYGDFQNIKALIDSQGTGRNSILYKDFATMKAAWPLDAVDFDDENSYDSESTIKFALMLGKLGYHVTMNPYTNNSYWISVVSQINGQRPGTVDGIHLQTYAGGEGNTPCSGWDFGNVPVYPGVSDQSSAPPYKTPVEAKAALQAWRNQCGISGGWLWIFDQIAGTRQVKQYAHDMISGVGGAP
jgi:hypothetical protein